MKTMNPHHHPGINDHDQVEVPDLATMRVNAGGGMSGPNQMVPPGASGSMAVPPGQPIQPSVPLAPASPKSQPTPQAVPSAPPYYTVDANEDDPFGLSPGTAGHSNMFASPIQLTGARPPVAASPATNHAQEWSAPMAPVSAPVTPVRRALAGKYGLWLKIMGAIVVIALGLGFLGTTLFASPTTSPPQQSGMQVMPPQAGPQKTMAPHRPPMVHPTVSPLPANQGTGDWVPAQLPAGWAAAGLNAGDELFAMRTAMTFTDREMSIDFRSVGTAANHGGTLTSAVFLLTPAAHQRFFANDVRETAVFFRSVERTHLIQVVVNAQPQQVTLETQGGQQFALVDVAFQLWQAKVVNGQAQQGKDLDPATGQPRLHYMVVLLVRVPPGSQRNGAPMGGTGWLVSDYALDSGQPALVQPA